MRRSHTRPPLRVLIPLFLFTVVLLLAGARPAQAAPALPAEGPGPFGPDVFAAEAAPVEGAATAPFNTLIDSNIQVSLDAPAQVLFGNSFSYTVTYRYNSATAGYGPYVDLMIPGGLNFVSASSPQADINVIDTQAEAPGTPSGSVTFPYYVNNRYHPLDFDPAQPPNQPRGQLISGLPSGARVVVLDIGLGSMVAGQPDVVITVNVAFATPLASNPLLPGSNIDLRARGGLFLGTLNAQNDWCCGDSPVASHQPTAPTGWPGDTTAVTLMTLNKVNNAAENSSTTTTTPPSAGLGGTETATGPSYPRSYTLTANVANGLTVDNLVLTDTFPAGVQVTAITPTPGTAVCTAVPVTPGGSMSCDFGSITGTAATNEAQVVISFYIPQQDSFAAEIISGATPRPIFTNTFDGSANWDPDGAGGPLPPIASDPCPVACTGAEIQAKPLAMQKNVTVVTDAIPAYGYTPGDVVEFSLPFQVSSYFAFDSIVITDVLGDGFDYLGNETLNVGGTNYVIAGSAAAPDVNGRITITFDISTAIGGIVGSGTTGVLTFRARVRDDYRQDQPGPETGTDSVDEGDVLVNEAQIQGQATTDPSGTLPNPYRDWAAESITIDGGVFTKDLFDITRYDALGTPVAANTARPGDTPIFRLNYTMPISDIESMFVDDWFPFPLFDVDDPNAEAAGTPVWTFTGPCGGVNPDPGEICYSGSDTFTAAYITQYGSNPAVTFSSAENRVRITFNQYDGGNNNLATLDLLIGITVNETPVSNLFKIVNQAQITVNNSQATASSTNSRYRLFAGEPDIIPEKSTVAIYDFGGTAPVDANNVIPSITPALVPAWLTPQTTPTLARWSGTLATPPNSNISNSEPFDVMTFAITLNNQGADAAFDLRVSDSFNSDEYEIMTAGFTDTKGTTFTNGLNFQVRFANGDPITQNTSPAGTTPPTPDPVNVTWFGLGGTLGNACNGAVPPAYNPCGPDNTGNTADDLFGAGIEIVDPGTGVNTIGACEHATAGNGHSMIVLTYDLRIKPGVGPGQVITNTAALQNYSNTEGGTDYTDEVIATASGPGSNLTAQSQAQIAVTTTKIGDPSGPLTVGNSYIQRISMIVPGNTNADVRLAETFAGPPDGDLVTAGNQPIRAIDGTYISDLPAGVRIRDRVLVNGLVPDLTTATFSAPVGQCSGNPGGINTWTLRTPSNPAGEVQVFWVDNRQFNSNNANNTAANGPAGYIYWVMPQVNNTGNLQPCQIDVSIQITIADYDSGTPAGYNWWPLGKASTNFRDCSYTNQGSGVGLWSGFDCARLEYINGLNGTVTSTTEQSFRLVIQQPVVSVTKGLGDGALAVGIIDGSTLTERPAGSAARAGDLVQYNVRLQNLSAAPSRSTATAYDVEFYDYLPRYLEFVVGSAYLDDGDGIYEPGTGDTPVTPTVGGSPITADAEGLYQTLYFSGNYDILVDDANAPRFFFRVRVRDELASTNVTLTANSIAQNTADANWYTLDNRSGRFYDGRYDQAIAGRPAGSIEATTPNQDANLDRAVASVQLLSSAFDKAFSIPAIAPGATTYLCFRVMNPNQPGDTMSAINFTDVLPVGVDAVTPLDLRTSSAAVQGTNCQFSSLVPAPVTPLNGCGGTLTYDTPTRTLTFTDGSLNAPAGPGQASECWIAAAVTGAAPGVFDNLTSNLGFTVGGQTAIGPVARASLVISRDLGMHKQFAPSPLQPGQIATLTFTLANTSSVNMVDIEFFEFLPLGSPAGFMEVANPPFPASAPTGIIGDCGPAVIWTPAAGDIDLTFDEGSLAPGATCQVVVNVQASSNASYVNRVDPANSAQLTQNRSAAGPHDNTNSLNGLSILTGGLTPAQILAALNNGTLNRGTMVFGALYANGAGAPTGPVLIADITGSNTATLVVLGGAAGGAGAGGAALTPTPTGTIFPNVLPNTGGRGARIVGWFLLGGALMGGVALVLLTRRTRRSPLLRR